ncbi:hypothetical protein PVAP13_8NG294784 [Panicum virgatum]|uniref:Uncharacterized protein n=1 Tax=Panicum virgatum TaxID=38727 RepID=A0A8T0PGE1_PANVG|nr:hypothetical protein PVAP13_8NG294784 [Panicum virgatum]
MYSSNLETVLYSLKASFLQVSNPLFMRSKLILQYPFLAACCMVSTAFTKTTGVLVAALAKPSNTTACSGGRAALCVQFSFTPLFVSLRPALLKCAHFSWTIDSRDPIGSKIIYLETYRAPYEAL